MEAQGETEPQGTFGTLHLPSAPAPRPSSVWDTVVSSQEPPSRRCRQVLTGLQSSESFPGKGRSISKEPK